MPPKSKAKGKKAAEPVAEEPVAKAVAMDEDVVQSSASSVNNAKENALAHLAEELWGSSSKIDFVSYKEAVVRSVYKDVLSKGNPAKFQLLEFRGYLENYLWTNYSADVCVEHTLSVLLVVNEKCKAGVDVFDTLVDNADAFKNFSKHVVDLSLNNQIEESLQESYVLFLINLFRSLDHSVVRQSALRYLSLPIWAALSTTRLQIELENSAPLQKPWQKLQVKLDELSSGDATASDAKGSNKKKRKAPAVASVTEPTEESAQLQRESQWFPSLVKSFMQQCGALSGDEPVPSARLGHMERFAELLIDLLSQLPTRRFLKALLDDMHFLAISRRWSCLERPECLLLSQLLQSVSNVLHFEVDDLTGKALTPQDTLERTNALIHTLQQVAYAEYPEEMKDIVFSSVGELGKRDHLLRHMQLFTLEHLTTLATRLNILTDKDLQSKEDYFQDPLFVKELLCDAVALRESQLDQFNLMSLLPTEKLLWDQNQLPLSNSYSGSHTLPLPKLNLQFLTVHDYLLRNFTLFRLESAYEVREDLTDAIKRMGPREGHNGVTSFGGWARMALPLAAFSVDEVSKPKLGEIVPKHVNATATVDISRFTGGVRDEWESFKNHDVVFLVTIDRPHPDAALRLAEFEKERKLLAAGKATPVVRDFQWNEEQLDFMKLFGVKYVRGGTVFEFRDEADVVLNDLNRPDDRKYGRTGSKRKLRLNLDPVQYYLDMKEGLPCYDTLNLLVRRNPKENNFKAILDTIRGLINTAAVGQAIPSWLHDVFLGYGDPAAANYRQLDDKKSQSSDYVDTFVDAHHLIDSFPCARDIVFESDGGVSVTAKSNGKVITSLKAGSLPPPPYSLTFSSATTTAAKSSKAKTDSSSEGTESILVRHITQPNQGPYASDAPPRNTVRFTPTQVEAIRSGVSPGLSVIVGPPGTGKTDVAVQIITNLYHNHPTQKILIVTHSNAALNDLFEKIMQRDVAPRHLLRLGSGESDLRESLAVDGAGGSGRGQGETFSKQGRVNWSLARRLELLEQVQALSQSLKVPGDNGISCETAEYFQIGQVVPRIQKFNQEVTRRQGSQDSSIEQLFPFTAYFSNTPAPLFSGSWATDLQAAVGCFRHLSKLFEELADYRAFELLHNHTLRSDYLLIKQARIVAMTCTHAAMTRGRLVELGFKYDSVVMEEAGQILEVETLIPMLLQDSDPIEGSRLKRVVLLGDHHQLPPVVKHAALQKFSHFDQSLFSRFIRLGVPAVHLDKQGRAKSEIASLYRWRYNSQGNALTDLDSVASGVYSKANAGFRHSMQLIDVPAFQGRGETSPSPYFYQNLGEAEYIVAVYQYMRLIGYPASKISILTSYNGQKHLISDIIAQRCQNAVFGPPAHVSTVDQFQGQQNDFVLLSLVRTESVGHVRDVRRLVVALSRARLGLYVFCRRSLFESCFELSQAFQQLLTKPTNLQLIAGEGYPSQRSADAAVEEASVHTVTDATSMGILIYQMVQLAQSGSN